MSLIQDKSPAIIIKMNTHGNYEYEGLVFDTKTRMVIGRQNEDGYVSRLTKDDLKKAEKHKFQIKQNEIRRPRSAYIHFCSHERPKIELSIPNISSKNVIMKLGSMWRKLDKVSKKRYEDMGRYDKLIYQRKFKKKYDRKLLDKSKLENTVKLLPNGVKQIINEFLQHKHRKSYDETISYIQLMLTKNQEMEFKKPYQKFFGINRYSIYGKTHLDHYRIGSIEPQYYGSNSILFRPHKILLWMRTTRNECYCCCDFTKFQEFNNRVEELTYEIFLDDSDDDNQGESDGEEVFD